MDKYKQERGNIGVVIANLQRAVSILHSDDSESVKDAKDILQEQINMLANIDKKLRP